MEQENISRIEEEVHKSLAKVMAQQQASKQKKSFSPYTVNRSYQSINLTSNASFQALPQISRGLGLGNKLIGNNSCQEGSTQHILNDITKEILNSQLPTHENEEDDIPLKYDRKEANQHTASFSPVTNYDSKSQFGDGRINQQDYSNNSSFVVINHSQNQWHSKGRKYQNLQESSINDT